MISRLLSFVTFLIVGTATVAARHNAAGSGILPSHANLYPSMHRLGCGGAACKASAPRNFPMISSRRVVLPLRL